MRKKKTDSGVIPLVILAVCTVLAVAWVVGMLIDIRIRDAAATTTATSQPETQQPQIILTQSGQTEPEATGGDPTETTVPEDTSPPPTEPIPNPPEGSTPEGSTPEATTPETTVPDNTDPAPVQPQALTELLQKQGITYDQLAAKGCTQLLTVAATGNTAQIRYFYATNGIWQENAQIACTGFTGSNGVSKTKKEGDRCTPAGLFSIGSAFYIYSKPVTGLDSFQITQDTYWVDDPSSRHYNQRVEGTGDKDWNSAEHMIDYSVYRYGFVIDYNTACVPSAGSAIFFHIGAGTTAGCIATSEQMVLNYLSVLDQSKQPHILILSQG